MSGYDRHGQQKAYEQWVAQSREARGDQGLHHAIGGHFEAFGIIEREMLRFYGLPPDGYLVDVGCGSGRLAIPLAQTHRGRYLGIDVVADLVAHTRAQVERPDWRVETVTGFSIPEADGCADMVCLFSVLTHLLHEQSYIYLEDCKRVLRPGGRIVISFLEFVEPHHWGVFQSMIDYERTGRQHPLNMFIERGMLSAWARALGLDVVEFRNGTELFVPLPHPVTMEDGNVMAGLGALGQSICVLGKPA